MSRSSIQNCTFRFSNFPANELLSRLPISKKKEVVTSAGDRSLILKLHLFPLIIFDPIKQTHLTSQTWEISPQLFRTELTTKRTQLKQKKLRTYESYEFQPKCKRKGFLAVDILRDRLLIPATRVAKLMEASLARWYPDLLLDAKDLWDNCVTYCNLM